MNLVGLGGKFVGASPYRGDLLELDLQVQDSRFRVEGQFTAKVQGECQPLSGKFSALPVNPAIGFAHILIGERAFAIEYIERDRDGINALALRPVGVDGTNQIGARFILRRSAPVETNQQSWGRALMKFISAPTRDPAEGLKKP